MRNSKVLLVLALALSMSCLIVASSHAAVFYVDTNDPGAADSNPGTEVQPWKTIQKAADTMTAGDTTMIKGGTYTSAEWAVVQPKYSGSAGNYITYKGYPGDLVIVDGTDAILYGIFIDQASYLRFENLTIRGCQKDGIRVDAWETNISNIILDDVTVQNNGRHGIFFWGKHDFLITDCIIESTTITNNNEQGVYLYDASDFRFDNLTITECGKHGLNIVAGENDVSNIIMGDVVVDKSGTNGIFFWGKYDFRITDCIIEDSTVVDSKQRGIYLHNNCDNFVITNNVVSNSGVGTDLGHNNIMVHAQDIPGDINTKTCSNINITNNITHNGKQGISVWGNITRVLVAENYAHHNGSCGIQIEGNVGTIPRNIIVRNNLCEYNDQIGWSEAEIWIDSAVNSLVEKNICRYSPRGQGLQMSDHPRNNIIRFNESYGNGDHGFQMFFDVDSNIIVHNIFYGNGGWDHGGVEGGIRFRVANQNPDALCTENIFKNNIIMNNLNYDLWVNHEHIENTFDYNDWYDIDELKFKWNKGHEDEQNYYDFISYQEGTGQDSNSISEDPLFRDPDNSNPDKRHYRLQSSSPCIDNGGFLTSTDGSGSGNIIIVHDSRYFSDGYGYIDGDVIRVGSNSPVRVVDVDDDTNTITVDRNISWNDGDAVSYFYAGIAPDIGPYEFSTMVKRAVVAYKRPGSSTGKVKLVADFNAPVPAGADKVAIYFDGIELIAVPFSEFKQRLLNPDVYKYVTLKNSVKINFDTMTIKVVGKGLNLADLSSFNGVDVELIMGAETAVENIFMEQVSSRRLVYSRSD